MPKPVEIIGIPFPYAAVDEATKASVLERERLVKLRQVQPVYYALCLDPACRKRFLPKRKNHLYCSPQCKWRTKQERYRARRKWRETKRQRDVHEEQQ